MERKIKCELYNDSFQNFKRYNIPKAQLVIADIPYCYDEKTECWTTKGWKKYTDLTYDDVVLSLNPTTLVMEYSGIKNIIIRDAEDEMVKFESKDIDLLVTKNHRMFAMKNRKSKGKGIRKRKFTSLDNIRLAKDVNNAWYIPRSGYKWVSECKVTDVIIPSCTVYKNAFEASKYETKEVFISLEKWLPFFGLWLADGCVCKSKGSNGRQLYTVGIKQSGDNRKIVADLFKDFPFKCVEYPNKGTNKSNFNIHSKQLWLYMRQFGKSKEKFIPRWILDLPVHYLEILWKWYTFGDSSRNGNGLNISSVSKQLCEDLQEIALKIGCLCQIRTQNNKTWKSTLYRFQFNKNSRNITYGSKQFVAGSGDNVWCITLNKNSVFLVRRNGKIAFCGNCVGNNFYGSNPMWYKGGDNKNGESDLAGKAAFYSDFNFNIVEYFHFCNRLLKKEPKSSNGRGKSSDAPAMIVFCSFEQLDSVMQAAKKYGFKKYIPIIFCKNYSPQVMKSNMRIVGATEYGLVLFRERLPKFRNNGKMVFNWFSWERDGDEIPKIHPSQKPVKTLKKLIEIFTDEGDVVIDPVAGSGTTLRAAKELKRHSFGFEIYKGFYNRAVNEMLSDTWIPDDNDIKGQMNIFDFIPAQED